MNTKKISFEQFIAAFTQICNKPIWRIIHPADGLLIIDSGQKYNDTVTGKNGFVCQNSGKGVSSI